LHTGARAAELEAFTATVSDAETTGTILASFYIDGTWTDSEIFFKGIESGATQKKTFTLAGSPTKLRLHIDDTDGWGVWQIKLGGDIILEKPSDRTTPFWVDVKHFCKNRDTLEINIETQSEIKRRTPIGKAFRPLLIFVSLATHKHTHARTNTRI
jgi:hypothetical protein